jgi:putative CocE/NonD family hydrolase
LPDDGLEKKIFYLSNPSSNLTGGKLAFNPPEQPHNNTLRYDPRRPVRSDANKMIQLPIDLSFYFKQGNDFLVYTSEPFNRPTTIIGNLYVDLSISSDAKDTDFVVLLMVVYEDGRSIRLGSQSSYELRARYRNGFDREELMDKGKIYNLTILINEIGHTFQKGHSLRIAITNSFFPWISANPNTGNPIANDTSEPVVSQQTIYYGKTDANSFHWSRVRVTTYNFKNSSSGNKMNIFFFLITFAKIMFTI